MTSFLKKASFACLVIFTASCAQSQGVFPDIVTSTTESEVILPNPVSIAIDETNDQIIVANSNVDIFFEAGSLAVLNVDATIPTAPVLSASQILETPNFAGEISFDDASDTLFVPFRDSPTTDNSVDLVKSYTVAAGSVTEADTGTVAQNPFGSTLNAGTLYVVCDDALDLLDTSLTLTGTIDLTTAGTAGLDDSNSAFVEYVAIDTTGNRAFVSNLNGNLFVVDLDTNALAQLVDGPESTRNLIIDNDTLYALDPVSSQVWVFDLLALDDPTSPPETVDDSTFLLTTIPVGSNPNGMVLDSTNHRLYVGNSNDNSISVIDTLINVELARISVDEEDLTSFNRGGNFPFALSLGTFGGTQYLFVASFQNNSIVMINTNTLQVVEVYPDNTL
jgi:YVTN family beta-propeller protein